MEEIAISKIQQQFQKKLRNAFIFRFFLLMKLPSAWLAGLKIQQFDTHSAKISVRFKWLNQNPFRSIYFAVLSMAAEMSTGLLSMLFIQDEKLKISMLVTEVKATFYKKAVGINFFLCEEGGKIHEAVETAKRTGEGITVTVRSTGYSLQNEIIAVFDFTWSFKRK